MSRSSMLAGFPSYSDLESLLPRAIERGEVMAYFQPQIDIESGRIVAIEALSRWRHPEFGMIEPSIFVPIAEDSGLIHELGRLMIDQSLQCAADWQKAGLAIEISVNVSAIQLSLPRFFGHVLDAIESLHFNSSLLTLEITESREILDIQQVFTRLQHLRTIGVGISIDDFGTGHSTMNQLLALGASELKIDRKLIQDDDEKSRGLMEADITLVHRRNVRVVAEGVETAEHLAFARELHCDRAQGFLIGRPEPRESLEQLLLAG